MRKRICLVVALFYVLMMTNYACAATPSLSLVLTSQTPYPVEPGQVVDIEVALQNTGYSDAERIMLEISPESPFSLLPGQERVKSFSKIGSQGQVTASYKLYVDKNAVSDAYELKFYQYSEGSNVKKVFTVNIQVQGKPKIVLENLNTQPERVEPGKNVKIIAKIKNEGTGFASHIDMRLLSNTSYILPVLSGGVNYINELKPGETKEAVFEMTIDNSAGYQTYPGMLILTYEDDSGSLQTTSFSFGIPVRGTPIIEILSAKVENSDLKVDIENIGTATAKALRIEFIQDGKMRDSSVTNELKPTKHKTIRFNGFKYGNALINISYLDESNQFFSKEIPISVKPSIYSEKKGEGSDSTSFMVPVLVLILVIESYYVWRIRKRVKK